MRTTIVLVVCALLGSCGPTPTLLDQILKQGELRVITQNSPTTYYLGAEAPRGIEYELASGFAERLGVRLRIYTTDEFWRLFPEVADHKADIAAAGLAVTDPRRSIVEFGPRYQHVKPQLIYRMGTPRPQTLADLMGGSLEVVAGSQSATLLNQARQRIPYLQWTERPTRNSEALVRRVARGEIDFAIVDSNEFRLLRHYYPEARVAFDLAASSDVAWALPKGADRLREAVAAYFAEIEATGKLEEILNRHDRSAGEFDYVGSRAFVRHLYARFPQYRPYFEEASIETGIDWRLLAAISYQESHWSAGAVSPTGVRGLMMLTEHSAEIVGVNDRDDPRESIMGGARYFVRVLGKFPTRIPEQDRELLALAAYNIGFGHVEDARIITQIQGGNPDSWQDVSKRLPLLADEAWYSRVRRGYAPGNVPVEYVDNVNRYYALLRGMGGTELLSALPSPPSTDEPIESTAPAS